MQTEAERLIQFQVKHDESIMRLSRMGKQGISLKLLEKPQIGARSFLRRQVFVAKGLFMYGTARQVIWLMCQTSKLASSE